MASDSRRAAGLPYVVRGQGPPAILVHGLALDRWFWRPLWRLLPQFALHSVDLPRLRAPAPAGEPGAGPTSVAQVARRLAAWHQAAGLPACPWVAHSLGAQVCVHLAVARPSPVSALVLLAPSVPESYTGYRVAELALSLLREPPALWWQILRRVAAHGLADPGLAAAAGAADHGLWELLGRIGAPTKVLYGGRDAFIPASRIRAVAAAIPGATRVELAEARHTLLYTHPVTTAAVIGAFLSEVGQTIVHGAR